MNDFVITYEDDIDTEIIKVNLSIPLETIKPSEESIVWKTSDGLVINWIG